MKKKRYFPDFDSWYYRKLIKRGTRFSKGSCCYQVPSIRKENRESIFIERNVALESQNNSRRESCHRDFFFLSRIPRQVLHRRFTIIGGKKAAVGFPHVFVEFG